MPARAHVMVGLHSRNPKMLHVATDKEIVVTRDGGKRFYTAVGNYSASHCYNACVNGENKVLMERLTRLAFVKNLVLWWLGEYLRIYFCEFARRGKVVLVLFITTTIRLPATLITAQTVRLTTEEITKRFFRYL